MIEGHSSYSGYKDSGLPSLGEIPVTWEVRQAAAVAHTRCPVSKRPGFREDVEERL